MSQEIEQIEARLTAYIDGQLPEKDRTEIEAYLASNPTHARLIVELQKQRAQLRSLPKEAVPAEIMDSVQAHVERHALLSDGDTSSSSMKINRWPQLGAVAAMLLLAVGLGVLVYQVLPSGGMKPDLVLAPPSVQQLPQVPPLNGLESLDKDAAAPAPVSGPSEPVPMIASAKQKDLRVMESAGRAPDAVERVADAMAMAKPAAMPMVAAPPTTLPTGPLSNVSAIVVSSDDPPLTRSLLATYLAENGLAYEVAKEPLAREDDVSPATQPGGAMSVALVVDRLQDDDALPTTLPTAGAPAGARDLIVVRNVPRRQIDELNQTMNAQRDGHQASRLFDAGTFKKADARAKLALPFKSEPAQDAAAVVERLRAASTQPTAIVANEAIVGAVNGNAPTTQGVAAGAASVSAALPGSGDVLVVVLAKAQATPAESSMVPASMPSTKPAPLPMTEPVIAPQPASQPAVSPQKMSSPTTMP